MIELVEIEFNIVIQPNFRTPGHLNPLKASLDREMSQQNLLLNTWATDSNTL